MFEKIAQYIKDKNVKGVYLPFVSDSATGKGSVSLTLVVISSICLVLSLVTKKVDNPGSFEFFLASISLYFGRKYTNKGTIVDPNNKETP